MKVLKFKQKTDKGIPNILFCRSYYDLIKWLNISIYICVCILLNYLFLIK